MDVAPPPTLSQRAIARLWWSPLRRPFEAAVRRFPGSRQTIWAGPLRGAYFAGGLAQRLGIYELHVQGAILSRLRPSAVFYDVGANNGFFTLLAARSVGPDGIVVAFEPYPPNVAKLNAVVNRNGLSNVQVIPLAVTNLTGRGQLAYVGNASTPRLTTSAPDALEVSTISLAEAVKQHHWPTLVKVDVEGAELQVLQGATHLLASQHQPDWIIEVHSAETHGYVRQFLESHGYDLSHLPQPRRTYSPYPRHVVACPHA